MIASLASPQAARITGRPISINGGISAAWLPDSIFKQPELHNDPSYSATGSRRRRARWQAPAEYPVRRGISLPSLTPRNTGSPASAGGNEWIVIASEATQSILPFAARWIASRSLSSGAHSRDPLARNDAAPIFTHISAFSRHDAPELCKSLSPPKEGAGNAGCPLHPQPRV
jgi:hypothetical protein